MAWILSIMTYGEFMKLITCIFLDAVEYVIPFLLQPIIGFMLKHRGDFTYGFAEP
jgi:hypothetical protein